MKPLKLILLIFLLKTFNLKAQESRFKEGETLNVWATSGLNMRDKPDAKAAKVTTIPYGAKVVVLPNICVKIPFEVEEFKGFIVKGYWLLIKYGNTEGFVFDGFLSRLPAPKTTKETETDVENYFDQIKKIGNIYNVKKCSESDWLNDTCEYQQKYEFGIIYKKVRHPEVGESFELKVPNISLYEGYFIAKYYYFSEENDKRVFDAKEKIVKVLPEDEGVGCHSSIFIKENYLIIENYCGC